MSSAVPTMVRPSKYDIASEALLTHVVRKDLDMRRETARMLRASRGTGLEAVHRSRQAVDARQLADISELAGGLLKVPSVSSEDIDDVKAKAAVLADARRSGPSQKSGSSFSTPAKPGSRREFGSTNVDAPSPKQASGAKRQSPLRNPRSGCCANRFSSPTARAAANRRGSGAAASGGGSDSLAPRNSQTAVSSPAVQAAQGLRRALRASAAGASGGQAAARQFVAHSNDEVATDAGGGGTGSTAAEALALARASLVLRGNRRSTQEADTDQEQRENWQWASEADHSRDGGRRDGRRVSGVLGVRQRVMAVTGADEVEREPQPLPGRPRPQQQQQQQQAQLDRDRSPTRRASVAGRDGGRPAAWETAQLRNRNRSASPSSSSSSSDDLSDRRPDRSSGGAAAAPATAASTAVPPSRRAWPSSSSGGGILAVDRSWAKAAAAALSVPVPGANPRRTASGAVAGGGMGNRDALHGDLYDSTSSSSSSSSYDEMDDTATARRRRAAGWDISSSGGGASVTSSAAMAGGDSAGVRKLRCQLDRARQSLHRLQLSSGGGGLPPPPEAGAAVRRSTLGGRPAAACFSDEEDEDNDDNGDGNDVRAGSLQDDDISQLLAALLTGQSTSARDIAAAAVAAAASGGGAVALPSRDHRDRRSSGVAAAFVGSSPSASYADRGGRRDARAMNDDDDDDDEAWRIVARPLPPGKRMRLLRALQQLHVQQPQLLQSRRHGRRLARLLRGVATSDAEAGLLMGAVTPGAAAGGGGCSPRRSSSGAVTVLAAMLGGRTSSDGTSGGGSGGWGLGGGGTGAAAMMPPRGAARGGADVAGGRHSSGGRLSATAARSLALSKDAALLAQAAAAEEVWQEVAHARDVQELDAAAQLHRYPGGKLDTSPRNPRSDAAGVRPAWPGGRGGSTSLSAARPRSPSAHSPTATAPVAAARSPSPPPDARHTRSQSPSSLAAEAEANAFGCVAPPARRRSRLIPVASTGGGLQSMSPSPERPTSRPAATVAAAARPRSPSPVTGSPFARREAAMAAAGGSRANDGGGGGEAHVWMPMRQRSRSAAPMLPERLWPTQHSVTVAAATAARPRLSLAGADPPIGRGGEGVASVETATAATAAGGGGALESLGLPWQSIGRQGAPSTVRGSSPFNRREVAIEAAASCGARSASAAAAAAAADGERVPVPPARFVRRVSPAGSTSAPPAGRPSSPQLVSWGSSSLGRHPSPVGSAQWEAAAAAAVRGASPPSRSSYLSATHGSSSRLGLLIPAVSSPRSPDADGGAGSGGAAAALTTERRLSGARRHSLSPVRDEAADNDPRDGSSNAELARRATSPPLTGAGGQVGAADAAATAARQRAAVPLQPTQGSLAAAESARTPLSTSLTPVAVAAPARTPTTSMSGVQHQTLSPSSSSRFAPLGHGASLQPTASSAHTPQSASTTTTTTTTTGGGNAAAAAVTSPRRRSSPAGAVTLSSCSSAAALRYASPSSPAAATRKSSGGGGRRASVGAAAFRDPAALAGAVQELRAAVAARSKSLSMQVSAASPELHSWPRSAAATMIEVSPSASRYHKRLSPDSSSSSDPDEGDDEGGCAAGWQQRRASSTTTAGEPLLALDVPAQPLLAAAEAAEALRSSRATVVRVVPSTSPRVLSGRMQQRQPGQQWRQGQKRRPSVAGVGEVSVQRTLSPAARSRSRSPSPCPATAGDAAALHRADSCATTPAAAAAATSAAASDPASRDSTSSPYATMVAALLPAPNCHEQQQQEHHQNHHHQLASPTRDGAGGHDLHLSAPPQQQQPALHIRLSFSKSANVHQSSPDRAGQNRALTGRSRCSGTGDGGDGDLANAGSLASRVEDLLLAQETSFGPGSSLAAAAPQTATAEDRIPSAERRASRQAPHPWQRSRPRRPSPPRQLEPLQEQQETPHQEPTRQDERPRLRGAAASVAVRGALGALRRSNVESELHLPSAKAGGVGAAAVAAADHGSETRQRRRRPQERGRTAGALAGAAGSGQRSHGAGHDGSGGGGVGAIRGSGDRAYGGDEGGWRSGGSMRGGGAGSGRGSSGAGGRGGGSGKEPYDGGGGGGDGGDGGEGVDDWGEEEEEEVDEEVGQRRATARRFRGARRLEEEEEDGEEGEVDGASEPPLPDGGKAAAASAYGFRGVWRVPRASDPGCPGASTSPFAPKAALPSGQQPAGGRTTDGGGGGAAVPARPDLGVDTEGGYSRRGTGSKRGGGEGDGGGGAHGGRFQYDSSAGGNTKAYDSGRGYTRGGCFDSSSAGGGTTTTTTGGGGSGSGYGSMAADASGSGRSRSGQGAGGSSGLDSTGVASTSGGGGGSGASGRINSGGLLSAAVVSRGGLVGGGMVADNGAPRMSPGQGAWTLQPKARAPGSGASHSAALSASRSPSPSPLSVSTLTSSTAAAAAVATARTANIAACCLELERQLTEVYCEVDGLVARTQGVKGVMLDGAVDLREQLAAMEEALEGLTAENRDLRTTVQHARTTYDNAAAVAGKIAELQQQVDLLLLDKHELQVQLDLARLSPPATTRASTTPPRDGASGGSASAEERHHHQLLLQQQEQQNLIGVLMAQVSELKREKAAVQDHARRLQARQRSPAPKSAVPSASASAMSVRANAAATPRTVPRAPPQAPQPPHESHGTYVSYTVSGGAGRGGAAGAVAAAAPPAARAGAAGGGKRAGGGRAAAGGGGNRGDADGLMLARISHLQRQVRVLAAENDSLRVQSSFSAAVSRASPGSQSHIRDLQGQVQTLGQQLETERRVRSHLYDMQVRTEGQAPLQQQQQQQQHAPFLAWQTPSGAAPQPVTANAQRMVHRHVQQQHQPYGMVATASVYGPVRPASVAPVADFAVTVEPLTMRRPGW